MIKRDYQQNQKTKQLWHEQLDKEHNRRKRCNREDQNVHFWNTELQVPIIHPGRNVY